jgi:Rrf2 family protein
MYLSRPAEYALRAMTYLARLESDERVRSSDLGEAVDVPAPFLSKIMRRLVAAGLVDAKKGHHGGFILAKLPAEIRFIDILRAVDFEPTADHCLFGLGNCDTNNPCPLHSQWSVLKGQIENWARSHTLGDFLKEDKDRKQK